jgi:putative aldouronate transport system permease protein
MLVPFLVLVVVFSYYPLYGWVYAFFDYRPGFKLTWDKFVGLKWFGIMLNTSAQRKELVRVLENTLAMSFIGIALSWLPIAFAVLLNELRNKSFKKFVQTAATIPNFISWVLVYSFAFMLFSVDSGLINKLGGQLGLISQDINFLLSGDNVWLSMVAWSTWKGLGWGAIMYLAAMSSIDQELYEAAHMDGASRSQRIRYVTIPGLMPTFFVLLLLSIANIINNGLEQYYVFQNAMNLNRIEVLDLYVYHVGFSSSRGIPLATAISMFKSLVSVALLFFANFLSKLVRKESIV